MLESLIKLLLALPALFKEIIIPLFKYLFFFATHAFPSGMIIWWILFWSAEHPARLTEPGVFLSLLIQAVLYISLYGIFWGMVVYPNIKFLIQPANKEEQK